MNECIEWLGAKTPKGYGKRTVNKKTVYVHRLAFREAYGPIPPGLVVMHICDNPSCINPEHLRLGTQQDNLNDMKAKGRSATGEANGSAKLTYEAVEYARRARRAGCTTASLAAELNVGRETVRRAVVGESW